MEELIIYQGSYERCRELAAKLKHWYRIAPYHWLQYKGNFALYVHKEDELKALETLGLIHERL